jgi:FKBP-type peptidyl-prolyl cis-trans isomerase FklB
MKYLIKGVLAASLIAAPALANEPKSDLEKLSYSLGMIIGEQISSDFGEFNPDFVLQGLTDSVKNPSEWKLDQDAIRQAYTKRRDEIRAQRQSEEELRQAKLLAESSDYLLANGKKDGVQTTASGLQFKVLTEGGGVSPKADDNVSVRYEGRLSSGQVFDATGESDSVSFALNQVIPGWTEGLQLMSVGSRFELTIPPELGYGSQGARDPRSGVEIIPPNSVLVFDVELLEINPAN